MLAVNFQKTACKFNLQGILFLSTDRQLPEEISIRVIPSCKLILKPSEDWNVRETDKLETQSAT